MKNIKEINLEQYAPFDDMKDFVKAISRLQKVWCWGPTNFTSVENKLLRFKVRARHFKGWVNIVANNKDLFDYHLTNAAGEIIHSEVDLYNDQIVDVIDKKIEWIPQYKH